MTKKICNICIVIIISISGLQSQILVKKGGVYIHEDDEFRTKKEIRQLVSSNPEAAFWLDQSLYNSKKANIMGLSSLGSALGCYILLKYGTKGSELNYTSLTIGLGAGALSCVFGTIGIYSVWKSNKQFDQGITVYNNGLSSSSTRKEYYLVRLQTKTNGIGIVIDF